jgi:TetR/AcrR family transcriptional regulator, regulator of cefoperazone and chloramphenicol sensitivity
MTAQQTSNTRHILLLEAGKLFAEKGFDGTSTRAIAEASGANLAAIHYHFGNKEALFQAVLQAICERSMQAFEDREQPAMLDTPTDIARTIRTRVRHVYEILTGPDSMAWQAQLILREMTQPSSAHSLIVESLAVPMHASWVAIHRRTRPQASASEAHIWALHLPAMIRLMMTNRPALERIIGPERCDETFMEEAIRQTADAMILLLGIPVANPGEATP